MKKLLVLSFLAFFASVTTLKSMKLQEIPPFESVNKILIECHDHNGKSTTTFDTEQKRALFYYGECYKKINILNILLVGDQLRTLLIETDRASLYKVQGCLNDAIKRLNQPQ